MTTSDLNPPANITVSHEHPTKPNAANHSASTHAIKTCTFCGELTSDALRSFPNGSACASCAASVQTQQAQPAHSPLHQQHHVRVPKQGAQAVNSTHAPNSYVTDSAPSRQKAKHSSSTEQTRSDECVVRDEYNQEHYYCRYCNTTWPLSSFKNRQQFGAHCSNCSRKKPPVVDEDGASVRPPKKPRTKTRRPPSSRGSGSYEYNTIGDLMQGLVNVVENQLVEEEELEEIHKELHAMKQVLIDQEKRRNDRLCTVQSSFAEGITTLRSNLANELLKKEEANNKDFLTLRNDTMAEFAAKEQEIQDMSRRLQQAPQSADSQQLNAKLVALRNLVSQKFEFLGTKLAADADAMERLVLESISTCEKSVTNQLQEFTTSVNYEFEESRINFLKLEKVIKDDPRAASSSEQE